MHILNHTLFRLGWELPVFSVSNPLYMTVDVLHPSDSTIWIIGIGEGFRSGTQTLGFNAGATYGMRIFGGAEHHHLAILSASYGRMIGNVKGSSWYRGNWELRGEIFGGLQFNSESYWLFGVTPHLRYHFATGTSWIPYADFGVGITSTDIRTPDLGSSLQLNLQANGGVNYFVRDTFAINFEGRYIHLSSGGCSKPNNGLNTIGIFVGVNKFF